MYTLTGSEAIVLRDEDGATIPNDPGNRDWQDYQKWLADGNTPNPYVPPPPVGPPPQTTVLYDHENRIRAQEGEPPLTLGDFLAKTGL